MLTFSNHWHANPPMFDRYGFAEQLSSLLWLVSEILITLEPYRIFESRFAYLLILILNIHPSMQNNGEGMPSISLAGRVFLVNMLITLEPHGMFNQSLHTKTL